MLHIFDRVTMSLDVTETVQKASHNSLARKRADFVRDFSYVVILKQPIDKTFPGDV